MKRIWLPLLLMLTGMMNFNLTSASATGVNYIAQMPKAYQPQGQNGGTDDYHCFLIDPKVKQDSILTAIRFIPQNINIVHHAILFRLPADQVKSVAALDNGGKGWSCFGGSGVGSMFQSFLTTPWLSAWVPGRTTDNAPAGYGYPFNKGDEIVLQVHYNLLLTQAPKVSDQSRVTFTAVPKQGSVLKTLGYDLFPAPVNLACPAGVTGPLCDRKASLADLAARTSQTAALESTGIALLCNQDPFNPTPSNTSTCDRKITKPEVVIAAAPHMHLLGRALSITVNPGSANSVTLLNRSNYNFDDQSSTVLKKPFLLKAGDTVRVQCTFDPKLRAYLPGLRNQAPKYVTWGEGSSDEMCLGVLITSNQIKI